MLKVGDKIKMVKPIPNFDMVGTEFEVTTIEDNVIQIKSNFGIGVMSDDEFPKYFTKVKTWTDWINIGQDLSYKTDGEKYVKVKLDGYKTKSSCHPCDEFNLNTGIWLCVNKIKQKRSNV